MGFEERFLLGEILSTNFPKVAKTLVEILKIIESNNLLVPSFEEYKVTSSPKFRPPRLIGSQLAGATMQRPGYGVPFDDFTYVSDSVPDPTFHLRVMLAEEKDLVCGDYISNVQRDGMVEEWRRKIVEWNFQVGSRRHAEYYGE